jgi:hypothetical protein
MTRLMLNLSKPKRRSWGDPPSCLYKNIPTLHCILMSTTFLEKDADSIYEDLEETPNEEYEDEYREDRMDQMISRYGY